MRGLGDQSKSARTFYCCSALLGFVIFGSLFFVANLSNRPHWHLKPQWSWSSRAQEAGILDPVLFREALYQPTDDRLDELLTVEPTAEHTHTVLVLHGLGNWASDVQQKVEDTWAPAHPNVRWFIPQGPLFPDQQGTLWSGWFQPWRQGGKRVTMDTMWEQVQDNLYDASMPNSEKLPESAKHGHPAAYSNSDFWEDEVVMMNSTRMLWRLLNEQIVGEGEGQVDWDKLIITGFSQAGFQIFSAYLPFRTHPDRLALNAARDVKLAWCQGDEDELFQPPLVDYSLDVLRALGYEVDFVWAKDVRHEFGPTEAQQAALDRFMDKVWA